MSKPIKDKTFKTVIERSLEPMVLVNRDGIIEFINLSFEKISGYSNKELKGQLVEILVPNALRAKHAKLRKKYTLRPSVRPMNMEINLHLQHKDGHDVPVDISLNPVSEEPNFFIIVATIREAKFQLESMGKMLNFIQHDPLTQLFTLDSFIDKLNYAIHLFKSIGGLISVFYIDIDDFKAINDTYGHHVGNELLKLFSNRLVRVLRESDVVSRYGGDEFCCFTTNANANFKATQDVANKILHTVSQPFVINNFQFTITASIGVSFFPMDATDATTLIQKADKAMYEAKQKKNTYIFFNNEHHQG